MTTALEELEVTATHPPTQDFGQAWLLLSKGSRSLSEYIDEVLGSCNLPRMMELQALNVVESAGSAGIRVTDLASALVTSKSNTTRLTLKLEHRGLLSRIPSQVDRRELRLQLTSLGRSLTDKGNNMVRESFIHSVPNFISAEEITRLILILIDLLVPSDGQQELRRHSTKQTRA